MVSPFLEVSGTKKAPFMRDGVCRLLQPFRHRNALYFGNIPNPKGNRESSHVRFSLQRQVHDRSGGRFTSFTFLQIRLDFLRR